MRQATPAIPHARLERATLREKLEKAVEAAIAALDALDGDPDLEPMLGAPESPLMRFRPQVFIGGKAVRRLRPGDQRHWADGGDTDERESVSEDEGAACEDEGAWDEREPDHDHMCNWQDEGSQLILRTLPVWRAPRARRVA